MSAERRWRSAACDGGGLDARDVAPEELGTRAEQVTALSTAADAGHDDRAPPTLPEGTPAADRDPGAALKVIDHQCAQVIGLCEAC
jgi:hypothetical protein